MEGYLLAFDQALANTGWAVGRLDGKELSIVDHGVHHTTRDYSEQERLLSIEELVSDLTHTYKPFRAYTESVFLRKGTPNQGKVLVKVETTIHNYLANFGVATEVVNSSPKMQKSWRRQLQIFREDGDKASSVRRLNIPNLKEHSADACAILLTGALNDELLTYDDIDDFLIPRPTAA